MDVVEGLGREFALRVCALDYQPPNGEVTIRRQLAARFDEVVLVKHRWQLRGLLAGAELALWYGLTNAIPRALAALPARPTSIRVVHTDRELDGVRFTRRWRRVIDGTVCVVPGVARRLTPVVFIPNGCSAACLEGRRESFFPSAPRRRKTLGFLGRLVPQKNAAWLVDHLGELDCNLLVQALDTPWQSAAELAARAAERGLGGRVRFLPPDPRVGTLLRSVDALAVVSEREGFPRTVVEAGMLGVPVIATRVGALPELFAEEILFVESRGGLPCANSLRGALDRLSPLWGRRLQARVRTLCSLPAVTARYRQFLLQTHDARVAAA